MTKTLTKERLVENVFRSGTLIKQEAKIIVECFFKTIRDQLISGETVKIAGFGKFVLRDKKARPGRNPKTGKDAIISARRVVTFRATQKFKKKIAVDGIHVPTHEK